MKNNITPKNNFTFEFTECSDLAKRLLKIYELAQERANKVENQGLNELYSKHTEIDEKSVSVITTHTSTLTEIGKGQLNYTGEQNEQ